MLAKALIAQVAPESEVTPEDLWETDELTLILNHGGHFTYAELWVESCWEGLMSKAEYRRECKRSGRSGALRKFVAERLTVIADVCGLRIAGHSIECEDGYDEDDEDADWLLTARLEWKSEEAQRSAA